MIGSQLTTRSPSRTNLSRSTPCVDGCCGPMLRTMSLVSRPAPVPTVSSLVSPCIVPRRRVLAAGRRGPGRAGPDNDRLVGHFCSPVVGVDVHYIEFHGKWGNHFSSIRRPVLER